MLARGAWCLMVVIALANFFISLPLFIAQLHRLCSQTACNYQQLTPAQAAVLKAGGLSLDGYVALTVTLLIVSLIVPWAVSALIIVRRPDDLMALLVTLLLVALGSINAAADLPQGPMPWLVPYTYFIILSQALILWTFLVFPSGRFAPRWTSWVLVALLAGQAAASFAPDVLLLSNNSVSHLGWLVALAGFATVLVVQLYRYRRVSSPLERQQTKWVVVGLAFPVTIFVVGSILALIFPALATSSAMYVAVANELGFMLPLFLPFGFGFAIMRYRLWDIDALINKALVYGSLTVLLAGVYAGLIVGLESLATLTRGDIANKPVALIISTLATVALVQPVRRRLQALIDRRFYRRKYNAEKTLAAFSATLHDAMDLDTLRVQVLDVVQETMQPAQVSLWLSRRPPPAAG